MEGDPRWWGWGSERRYPPDETERLLSGFAAQYGALDRTEGIAIGRVRPRGPRIGAPVVARLSERLGAEQIRMDDAVRVRHAFGQAYPELVRAMRGELRETPDAVVLPGTAPAVAAVLALAREEGFGVVPFGGGTSVTGGIAGPSRPYVVLSTRRLDRVVSVDSEGRSATVEAGILGPDLERELGRRRLTLGHFPQSFERSTLGGWIATRSAGQQSSGYGRIEDLVISVRLATPEGELALAPRPAAAEGPDLLQMVLGNEGELGVVTDATLRVRAVPERKRYEAWVAPSFEVGIAIARSLAQKSPRPTMLRLSDEQETALIGRKGARGVLLILGYEGSADEVEAAAAAIARRIQADARGPDTAMAAAWYEHRFDLPYLRDELLMRGLLIDVVETAALWKDLVRIWASVRQALNAALERAMIMCHVSHVYEVGASLYFTFLARRAADFEAQWLAAKEAALSAIVAGGGVVSHHHGIGTHHRAWRDGRVGPRGVALLRALTDTADPTGVLRR